MKFYVIPPVTKLDLTLYNKQNNVYCLAHLCLKKHNPLNYQEYKDFFKKCVKQKKYVTLDNGTAEGNLINNKELIKLVKYIIPSEVVTPDVLYNNKQTIKQTKKFIILMKKNNLLDKTILFGVPQGKTIKEYLESYIWFLNNKDIKVIGLSKLSVPKCFSIITNTFDVAVNRRYLVKLLNELMLIKKPIHLLGMRNPTEYRVYKNIDNIRSTDSCFTVLLATQYKKIDELKPVDFIETPHNYFHTVLNKKQLKIAKHNIRWFKKELIFDE
jgi:hypothetical protein